MYITSKNVWINEAFQPATLKLENGNIKQIIPSYQSAEGAEDYGELYVIPGMIDIHTHGFCGGGATDGDPEVYRKWQSFLPGEGVTTFLIGTQTKSEEKMRASLQAVKTVKAENLKGAFIHGIFFQGPYNAIEYCGGYDKYECKKPNLEEFKFYDELSGHNIRSISLAPETDKNHEVLKYCVSQGIRVCLGFTGCSLEEAVQAIDEGASNVIHCFNCMAPIHHRKPNLPVAAMTDDRIFSEVMTDGLHVHPSVINLVGRMKGKDKLITVTDSTNLKGCEPGLYKRGNGYIRLGEDGTCVWEETGAPAGTAMTMIQNVRCLQTIGKLPLATAINAATINPATMLGIHDHKGLIKEGYQADFAIYDENYSIKQTYIKGEKML